MAGEKQYIITYEYKDGGRTREVSTLPEFKDSYRMTTTLPTWTRVTVEER